MTPLHREQNLFEPTLLAFYLFLRADHPTVPWHASSRGIRVRRNAELNFRTIDDIGRLPRTHRLLLEQKSALWHRE
jgi:hypothetical protein